MFKKLDLILERFNKLNELVSDADVISRIDEWKKYPKVLVSPKSRSPCSLFSHFEKHVIKNIRINLPSVLFHHWIDFTLRQNPIQCFVKAIGA